MAPWLEAIVIILGIVLVARAIKRSSKLLQRFFIPSSLVAGFAALLLGPQLIGWIPDTITNQWQAYPSFLINIVFAGLFLGHAIPSAREVWQKSAPMLAFGNVLAWGQYVLGIGLTLLILGPLFNAPPMTGALMEIGFEGGHGTAAGLSQTFSDLGWPAATDIALGLATVSIVAAIASGIIIINLHQRRAGRVFDEVAMKKQQQRMIRNGYSLTKFANKLETNPKELVFTVLLFAA